MDKRMKDAIRVGAERGLNRVSEVVERDLKGQVPVVTGRLQRSIGIENEGDLVRSVGTDLYYAQYVERHKSFIDPVLLKDEDLIADIIIEEIFNEIDKL